MSQLYDLYVGNLNEAQAIWEHAREYPEAVDVPAFDELKQLSLLSLFKEISMPQRDWGVLSSKSDKTAKAYHEHFALLYPSEVGKSRFITKFPDDLVQGLGEIDDDTLPDLVDQWIAIEPSFADYKWTRQDVEFLLTKVCKTCKTAIDERKHVLFKFSL